MAAVIEQKQRRNGIIWPISIAPYHVIVIPVNTTDSVQMELAEKILPSWEKWALRYCWMTENGGVKFKDADLIGIPIRITVGKRGRRRHC